ncbi:hypothetical protein SHEEN_48 [Mycobacterium phage Sheen]|uniref:Uncharacterized protein n=1 Tax=Mycobacterium phage Sheen TaxID=1589274 RepID=A0A0B5A5X6_9CAUD|nr:hypothetical protein AVV31_gp46 [Mycobacterium phage Sheen]AJD82466.1 hypothetical protein SHEEN_48 [Mycobacterium phage Sheen]
MADSYLRVHTIDGDIIQGIGEVVVEPNEGGDGRLYLVGDNTKHTVFNMKYVLHYFTRPLTEEEEARVNSH